MPIGKNAIKRVANNGYSNVKSSAPDMENSVVNAEKSLEAKRVTASKKASATSGIAKAAPKKEAEAAKKSPAKKKAAPKKSMESEPMLSPVKTAERVTKKKAQNSARQGEGYVNLGGELPIHLL